GLAIALLFLLLIPPFAQVITGNPGLVYLMPCMATALAAIACVVLSRSHWGLSSARWTYLCFHFLFRVGATILAIPVVGSYLPTGTYGWTVAGISCVALLFLLLALTSLHPRRDFAIRAVDTALLLLLTVTALPPAHRMMSGDRALRAPILLLFFLCLTAGASYLSSSSRSNVQFSALVTRYIIAAFVARSFATVAAASSSFGMTLLYLALAAGPLFFCWDANRVLKLRGVHAAGRKPGAFSHNLLPSVLTFGAATIAAIGLAPTPQVQRADMLMVIILFLTRTHLLYREHLRERDTLRDTAKALERQANEDPKTGIGNRKWLAERFDALAAMPRNFPMALYLLDNDGFSQVNQNFNYGVGDTVLRAVAAQLLQCAEQNPRAVCARLRGDEFALLLPRCNPDTLQGMSDTLRQDIRTIHFDFGYRASVSIGVSTITHGSTLRTLLEEADEALFTSRSKTVEVTA
ncbi:MAG: GGDEF domain-containing protein, partial [Terriglobus sp.]